jgi:hypothetical protein
MSENIAPPTSPGTLPSVSISRSMSAGSRLRVQTFMKPWSRRSALRSAWKSTGVTQVTRLRTLDGCRAA